MNSFFDQCKNHVLRFKKIEKFKEKNTIRLPGFVLKLFTSSLFHGRALICMEYFPLLSDFTTVIKVYLI